MTDQWSPLYRVAAGIPSVRLESLSDHTLAREAIDLPVKVLACSEVLAAVVFLLVQVTTKLITGLGSSDGM
jgi:hypothetical protein